MGGGQQVEMRRTMVKRWGWEVIPSSPKWVRVWGTSGVGSSPRRRRCNGGGANIGEGDLSEIRVR
ncbi:transcription factor bHLH117 [Pyrus ussuriensis x Pyrus communis]|uniref:Transcription factor bHLH117 n=1 Tax=Pyrus ussuriensis x Pyrus communis TaxID=2448454 RepID=A0A5N5GDX4_9ROSA|nr:transcription factor bHLH117 [Pyrus ussuriensis x Pyrus communis]